MHNDPLHILMVEDNAAQAKLLRAALQDAGIHCVLDHATELRKAIHCVKTETDLVLLDLGLPDSYGVDTVRRMREAAPEVPILVLTGPDNQEMAIESVREGAQDYIDKTQLSGRLLGRVIEYAVERSRTERQTRHTNEMLQALIDACPLAIIALHKDATVMTWNSAAESMFGWKEEEVLNRPLPTVPEEARREFEELLNKDLQGRARRAVEVKRLRRDGTVFDVSISTSPIRDRSGQTIAVMGVLEDITQRKAAERERAALQDQLHQAQKLEAVGELAAGVAHDFNNLLTVILGNVDRLSKLLTKGDERRSILGMIEEAARQATGVTRSLLTFSHKIPTVKELLDFNWAVEESARLLERLLPRSIELHLDLPGRDRIRVVGDRSQLQQVILNLAINARDAMPGGGHLTIRLSRQAAESANASPSTARLEIIDTGTGIAPENLPLIFDPFFTTKPRGQGTGLGLSIVRSIVEDHDGRVEVESVLGRGSRFAVTLPASLSEEANERCSEPITHVPRGNNELVLLAEDDTYVREVVASALRSFGYRVLEVPDGSAALAAHTQQQGRISAFVLDHDLPKKAGLACIREIRQRGDGRPAILTSGSVGPEFEQELEVNTILLRKPFQMSELARALARSLQVQEPG